MGSPKGKEAVGSFTPDPIRFKSLPGCVCSTLPGIFVPPARAHEAKCSAPTQLLGPGTPVRDANGLQKINLVATSFVKLLKKVRSPAQKNHR